MSTPLSSHHLGVNLTAQSFDSGQGIGSGSLSDASSLQYPPTPPTDQSFSSSPYDRNQQSKYHSSSSSSSSSYNKARVSDKKQHCLDLSGPFPYFDEIKEENESVTKFDPDRELTKEESNKLEQQTLSKHGYLRSKHIATTLQGEVFNGKLIRNLTHTLVIKKTSKKLHKLGITITKSGKSIPVKENIVAEAQLLAKFTNNSPPATLVAYYDFFEDSHYYYLVMEHGGSDYFDFVVKCQDLISSNKLSLSEWRKHCKFMFAQMVQFIRWMHNKMNCCYLDISLENMLIKDTAQFDEKTATLSGCYITFIDFGLSEFFDRQKNPNFLCQKYVGKTHYKAPKVYGKKEIFCADKADVWSLGVCLFMMVIGAPPYNKPVDQDVTYQFIKYQQIAKLLQEWGRIKYVTANLHDLLSKMLTYDESKRITLDEIVKHPWIQHYFPEEQLPPPQIKTSIFRTNITADDVPQTDDELPQMSSRVTSPSVSLSQPSYAHAVVNNQKINVMVPQQCISYSVSRKSVSHSRSSINSYIYSNRHRYSSPYSPYSPCSPTPNANNQGTASPRPIIQSRTSQHDHSIYLAALDESQKNKKLKKKNKKQKKKTNKAKKTFFKLFGGH